MEPVSAALLLALAGSVGSSAGQQAWDALSALVRRPFHRNRSTRQAEQTAVPSGEAQCSALADNPHDQEGARQFAAALAARAEADPVFAQALDAWHRQTRLVLARGGNTRNTVSGGRHSGVVQARDVNGGIMFGSPTPRPRGPGERPAPET